jgi:ubiquinone/menaquinone biosynthesis C-methylase UbiE
VNLDPHAYSEWRATTLGTITEAAEQALVFRLAGPLAGRHVLDAGCGDGAYAIAAANLGARVTACDLSPSMIAEAKHRAKEAGVHVDFHVGDLAALPYPDDMFDVVLAVTVLCFVPEATAALRELSRVLAPGGRLVLGELGRWSLWAARRRVRAWLGSDLWRNATFRSAQELRMIVSAAGLHTERIEGAVYYPPCTSIAKAIAPIERRLGACATFGAAFIACTARKSV